MAMNDKTFSEALTFTRATPKWVWDGTGKLVEVPVDQPAYDHDPVTGEALGVLIEPGATNLYPSSVSLAGLTTSFDASNENTLTTFLDGVSSVFRLVSGRSVARTSWDSNVAFGSGVSASIYVKADVGDWVMFGPYGSSPTARCYFNIAEGVKGEGEDGATNWDIEPVGGGWFRLSVSTSATDHSGWYLGLASADGNSGGTTGMSVFFAAPQLETGSVATSYIPTNGAAVTRAADSMSRTLGAEFNPSAGVLYAHVTLPTNNPSEETMFFVSEKTTGANIYVDCFRRTGGRVDCNVRLGSGNDILLRGPTILDAANVKAALRYDALSGELGFYVNGVLEDSAAINPHGIGQYSLSMWIGTSRGAKAVGGCVRDARHYPYAMTEAELIELTAL